MLEFKAKRSWSMKSQDSSCLFSGYGPRNDACRVMKAALADFILDICIWWHCKRTVHICYRYLCYSLTLGCRLQESRCYQNIYIDWDGVTALTRYSYPTAHLSKQHFFYTYSVYHCRSIGIDSSFDCLASSCYASYHLPYVCICRCYPVISPLLLQIEICF